MKFYIVSIINPFNDTEKDVVGFDKLEQAIEFKNNHENLLNKYEYFEITEGETNEY